MKPCEVCRYRDRRQTKEWKKEGGCDLFSLNPDEYKQADKKENTI